MELEPRCREKILLLLKKGVDIPNPVSIHIGRDVDAKKISGDGVRIDPGCRIHGAETSIGPGARLGREAPVTVENCQLGRGVELKGGYARESTFLREASMGLGAQVREGCLLEEQASGAHCVGLKQTILFPFVTLGSLINFCDCFMAGGTSRRNHSEVGSSYIHFNFTPDGEKATPTLVGDVPRGVMLDQAPIFLGGQGGIVGPQRIAYGSVLAAGSILRRDVLEEKRLIVSPSPRGLNVGHAPRTYTGFRRILEKNLLYIANLTALEQWYEFVRRPFLEREELGSHLYAGARKRLGMGKEERLKRLGAMAEHMVEALGPGDRGNSASLEKLEFHERFDLVRDIFCGRDFSGLGGEHRDLLLEALAKAPPGGYIEAIQSLPRGAAAGGTRWLEQVVSDCCSKAAEILPSSRIFS